VALNPSSDGPHSVLSFREELQGKAYAMLVVGIQATAHFGHTRHYWFCLGLQKWARTERWLNSELWMILLTVGSLSSKPLNERTNLGRYFSLPACFGASICLRTARLLLRCTTHGTAAIDRENDRMGRPHLPRRDVQENNRPAHTETGFAPWARRGTPFFCCRHETIGGPEQDDRCGPSRPCASLTSARLTRRGWLARSTTQLPCLVHKRNKNK
jgi:hypothetical protein